MDTLISTNLPKRLNLGCGSYKKPGFLNVDNEPSAEPDLLLDLEQIPYPFPDNHFEEIRAYHVLEHLSNPFAVMREIHRILAPNGLVIVRVPHFSRGFTHAGHKRGFDVTFSFYFSDKFPKSYVIVPFKLEYMRLRWFAQPYLKREVLSTPVFYTATILGKIIDFFANLSPFITSRLWCYWIGGFEEIEFRFRKITQ